MNKNRLVAAFLFIGALAGLGSWTLYEASANLPDEAAIDLQVRRVAIAESLLKHAKDASAPVVQLLLASEREQRVRLYTQIDRANAAADEDLKMLATLGVQPDTRWRAEMLSEQRMNYDARYTAAVEEIERSGAQEALAQFWTGTRDALGGLVKASEGVVGEEQRALAALQNARDKAISSGLRFVVAGGLAMLIAFFAGRLSIRPNP
ncbi:hypothetical protein AB6Q56_02015 [Dechloromonas sp. ARDL1]|uniref:hypothetical protein n=1 Tax=Dechloromonas sp. ARDL1 TaxID=3322121 RepID=UPI003DA74203